MTIPGDTLNRWWAEAAGANPSRVDEMRPALVAFMAFNPGQEPSFWGTGFVIAGGPDFALVVTARHVLIEGIARAQRPRSIHASTALFVDRGATFPSLDPKRLKALWMGSQNADMMNVAHVGLNDTLDIACCIVTPQEHAPVFRPTSLPLDIAVPAVGELIHMVSLENMIVEEHVPPDAEGKGQTLHGTRRVSIRIGVVTDVHPRGLRHYRWPCFTTSIPAEPGMSGGLIILPRDGKTIGACGIVCADNSPLEARADWKQCGESIAACAWPALALRVPETIPSTPDTPTFSLYDFMRAGRMDAAIGGIDRVTFREMPNGDGTIALT